ncbi:translocation protein SEC63 homolog [Rhopilema esculentum]|uniref:translocation protein SEC63 homolog n=1 Tax=Rhopilema esculentum TaxID=499914 RepID=UPI0031D888E8|eukprot:gene17457-9062_t
MTMQFEYDDKGTTFYYFLLSFFAMILLPITYFLWPDKTSQSKQKKSDKPCYCSPCMEKRDLLKRLEPNKKIVKQITRAVLIILWALLIAGVFKVSQFEKEYAEYNPYSVLEIDPGATTSEIKKQYRKLSLKYHPDKEEGDSVKFMRIAKAYEALTDEEARKNWEEYGNPDGPQATTFGIALPSWIVDKKNSMWVLAVYGLAFMVILPVAVGTWWYRSIKYSSDEVLMDTEQIYWYFLHRTPNMSLKRIIMILAASFEFEKGHNNEVQERPSDNIEIPMLIGSLPNLNEKNKEIPLCYPYSVKARALLHAHLSRLDLPADTLSQDLELILKKCPYLIKEMISIVNQLTAMAKMGRVNVAPRLETLENLMKFHAMIVQAVWECKSPFLMLPHITQDHLRHFTTKKRHIKTIRHFVGMKNDERRMLLRTLSDEQYQDIINVCWSYPHLEVIVDAKVMDEKDADVITAGSIVTVNVELKRKCLGDFFEDDTSSDITMPKVEEEPESKESTVVNKGWQKKQKKGGKKPKTQPNKQQQAAKKKQKLLKEKEKLEAEAKKNEEKDEKNGKKSSKGDKETDFDSGAAELNEDSDSENEDNGDESRNSTRDSGNEANDEDDDDDVDKDVGLDDDEWDTLQADIERPEAILEAKSKDSYPVHAPYFPLEKQEYWWVYIVSRKTVSLITPPQFITCLKDEHKVSLRFSVPEKPGIYHYQAVVRSDSYIDFDMYQNFKIEVTEARAVELGAQWDFTSDEEKDEDSGESIYETEEED